MSAYAKAVQQHLTDYKANRLGIQEDGVFHYRGREIRCGHILPLEAKWLNLLEPYREKIKAYLGVHPEVKLHRYFHHLNSSQALCFNLFYPLLAEKSFQLFLQFLSLGKLESLAGEFEKQSPVENAARRTSFDFYLALANGEQIFVEVKYTEEGFGKAKNDCEHREKFAKTYLPLFNKSRYLSPKCKDEQFFLGHYQVLRNLVHIDANSYVVFLFPSANAAVAKEAEYAASELLTAQGKARFHIAYIEDLSPFLEAKFGLGPLGDYYRLFSEKYLPLGKWNIGTKDS